VACLGPAAGTAATTNGSCVTNLAGYVADVKFYRPNDVNYTISGSGGKQTLTVTPKANPVSETDRLLLGKSACIDGGKNYTVVISVKDGKLATAAIVTLAAIGGAVVCAATDGTACGAATVVAGIGKGVTVLLPPAAALFYVGQVTPGQSLSLSGTVYNPSWKSESTTSAVKCNSGTQGWACTKDGVAGTCTMFAGSGDCKHN
jgi:hypothetical protein